MLMRVYVYYNLHKHKWSIKCLDSGRLYGRVVGHADQLLLKDATFKVSEAGRQRVLKEKRKNVHAGVVGYLQSPPWPSMDTSTPVTYNPYKYETFVLKDDETPIHSAPLVWMSHKQVFI